MAKDGELDIQQTIDALRDTNNVFPTRYLYRLSDLSDSDFEKFAAVWTELPDWRRKGLMEDIAELSSEDMLLSYDKLCCLAAYDENPQVCLPAVRALINYEEEAHIPIFLDLLAMERDERVQAAATAALGFFVWLGEIEEINNAILTEIEDALIKTVNSERSRLVRLSALESLGYSSRDEVPALIEQAYHSGDDEWISSALFAMGRSADEKWHPLVLSNLENEKPLLRFQAVRAAGELDIKEAYAALVELIDDEDEDIRFASIWSLSQIGGADLYDLFDDLYKSAQDEDERELLEDALDNLTFNMEIQSLPMMDYSPDDEEALFGDFYDDFEIDLDDDEDLEV